MAGLDGAGLDGIERLQAGHDLPCREGLNLKLIVSRFGNVLGKGLTRSVENIE